MTNGSDEGGETARWDRGIESLLVGVEECATLIEKRFPSVLDTLSI